MKEMVDAHLNFLTLQRLIVQQNQISLTSTICHHLPLGGGKCNTLHVLLPL